MTVALVSLLLGFAGLCGLLGYQLGVRERERRRGGYVERIGRR